MKPTDRSLTFAPFRVRSFRFQWPADLLTSWAFEMETLILSWYVMVRTGSVVLLTVFASLSFLGTLAAPMFGVLGDRLGGRAMLCVMRASYAGLAGILMVLGLADALTPTAVFVVAALAGIVRPNDLVMRNALIGDTIPRDHLMGALGMSRATMDSARVAGALAGASLSAALGVGRAYVVVAGFYLASLALTFGVSRERPVPDPGGSQQASRRASSMSLPRPSNRRDLMDGLRYVWTTPRVLAAMWLAFLVNLTAYPVSGGPAGLRGQGHLRGRRQRTGFARRRLFLRRPSGLDLHGRDQRTPSSGTLHDRRHRDVVCAAALVRSGADHDRRHSRADPDRLRPEHRDDLDVGELAPRRRRPVQGARDGRADAGGLRPAAGPAGVRRAHRADRFSGDRHRLLPHGARCARWSSARDGVPASGAREATLTRGARHEDVVDGRWHSRCAARARHRHERDQGRQPDDRRPVAVT